MFRKLGTGKGSSQGGLDLFKIELMYEYLEYALGFGVGREIHPYLELV